MLTPKENFLETIKKGGKPDRIVDQYEAFVPIMNEPLAKFTRGNRVKGTVTKDRWGTTISWPDDQVAAMPHVTEENKVLPDITEWKEYVKVPDLRANCTDWKDALDLVASVDRNEKLVMGFMGTGIFEQAHFLMGFEDTLMNLLAEPEDMADLLEVIKDYRLTYAKLLVENLKPDIILSHDDWGTKMSLFMNPDTWRELFKPLYAEIYGYMKDNGVIVMHHADSFLEPIVEDMAEIGIDLWQGVLPSNNIADIKKRLDGKMALMGGIDSVIDRVDTPEEEIRTEVRRVVKEYCLDGVGGFIPSMTYGLSGTLFPHVEPIISDEIKKCNEELFK